MEGLALFVTVNLAAIGALFFIAMQRKDHWRAIFKRLLIGCVAVWVGSSGLSLAVSFGANHPKSVDAVQTACCGAMGFAAACFIAVLVLDWLGREKP